jgi:hypothetical protein
LGSLCWICLNKSHSTPMHGLPIKQLI